MAIRRGYSPRGQNYPFFKKISGKLECGNMIMDIWVLTEVRRGIYEHFTVYLFKVAPQKKGVEGTNFLFKAEKNEAMT